MKSVIEKTEKQFGDLSQFIGRGVELFRSSDQNNTAIYFTEHEYAEREKMKAFFEVLCFDLYGGDHQLYIRYPNTDYFVEIYGGGSFSGRGALQESDGTNLWQDEFRRDLRINKADDDMVMFIGDSLPEFNFLKRVGGIEKSNQFTHGDTDKYFNYDEVKKSLELKYLMIPTSIYKIEYAFIEEKTNFFVLSIFPAFNLKYDNHKLFAGTKNDMKEYSIIDFKRYRDGGTTIITAKDNLGNEHILFSPQRGFPTKEKIFPKWNDNELKEMDAFDANEIAHKLGIILSEKFKNRK